jgi:hypothetical protein
MKTEQNNPLRELYRSASKEARVLLRERFTAKELGVLRQDAFDDFFKEMMINKVCKYLSMNHEGVSFGVTARFELLDCTNAWLFDIRHGKEAHFWYSDKAFKFFNEKFGCTPSELNQLMLPVLKEELGLEGITPIPKFLLRPSRLEFEFEPSV